MVNKRTLIALAPPAPRILADDLPNDRDLTEAKKDTLWDFTDGGAKIWKEPQDEASKLTLNLKRLWVERGDFSQLTIETIEKQKSEQEPEPELEVTKSSAEDVTENKASTSSETITVDELWDMRMQMAHQLLVMSGELSTGLDLLNTLLAPLAPEAVDTTSLPLPPGGIAPMTHSLDHLAPLPEPITLITSSVSLMRKRKAAQKASSLLKRAAGEINREAKRSQNEWETLLKLREAGWNMRPKGAKPGADMSLMGRGAERVAKEIGIGYATTEAAEALRASSFASLEPLNLDDHESTQISLKLPPRPRRRLTITLTLPNQPIERFSPWDNRNLQEIDVLPFGEDLELARAEILEEEIFGEISKEAQSSTTYRTSTSDRSVFVNGFWEDAEACFEMLESHEEKGSTTEKSPKCRLISALIRLLMISIYRSRRSYAIGIISPNTQPSQPKILEPVLDLIVFSIYTHRLHKLFLQAISDLKPTKLEVEGELDPIVENASEILNLICGRSHATSQKLELSGVAALRIMGRRSITFSITCPVVISFWLKDEPMRIGTDQLYSVLVNGINQSIIGLLIEMILSEEITTKQAPTGLVCQSTRHKIFLTPKFHIGTGLTIKAQELNSSKTMGEHKGKTEELEQGPLSSLDNYMGQVGLGDWVERLRGYMLA